MHNVRRLLAVIAVVAASAVGGNWVVPSRVPPGRVLRISSAGPSTIYATTLPDVVRMVPTPSQRGFFGASDLSGE